MAVEKAKDAIATDVEVVVPATEKEMGVSEDVLDDVLADIPGQSPEGVAKALEHAKEITTKVKQKVTNEVIEATYSSGTKRKHTVVARAGVVDDLARLRNRKARVRHGAVEQAHAGDDGGARPVALGDHGAHPVVLEGVRGHGVTGW